MWTAVTAAPPGYTGAVPFGFGVVELTRERLRVVTRLTEADPAALDVGHADAARRRRRRRGPDDDGTDVRHAWAVRAVMRGRREARASRSPASASIRSGGSTTAPSPTWACTRCAPRSPRPASPAVPGRVLRHRVRGVAAGHKVLGALARTGMPIVDVEAGCASGGAALQLAAGAIRAGQYDCVLVFGIEKMPKGIIRSSFFEPWREEAGLAATPAYFALRAQRLMRESGLTKEHLAQVVVKNRRHGVHNPNAMFRKEVDADDVLALAARVRAAAPLDAVLAERGRGRGRAAPRRATRPATRSRSRRPRPALAPARQRARRVDAARAASTTPTSRRRRRSPRDAAYEEAGIGPDDLDVVECQDTDAARELLAYEELGLCAAASRPRSSPTARRARRGPAGQPERRPAVEGRAARRVGARPGGRARPPAAGRGRARQVEGARVGPRAHRRPRRQRLGRRS